jgi:hypothetical protein
MTLPFCPPAAGSFPTGAGTSISIGASGGQVLTSVSCSSTENTAADLLSRHMPLFFITIRLTGTGMSFMP